MKNYEKLIFDYCTNELYELKEKKLILHRADCAP